MSDSSSLAVSLLACLDITVLRRIAPATYQLYGKTPNFYRRMFPAATDAGHECPWRYSRTLEHFIDDAEHFFSLGKNGVLYSDIWTEEGLTSPGQALTACAANLGEEQVLMLRLLEHAAPDGGFEFRAARTVLLGALTCEPEENTAPVNERFDPLTTLYTRQSFMSIMATQIDQVSGIGGHCSLLILDIDDFKGINDVYGHDTGDKVLSSLGLILRQFLRREDVPARIDGEEFAILAPFTMQHQALRMAEKLRVAISEHGFGSLPPLTVSIGCTTCYAGDTPDTLMERAYQALVDAKENGKNLVRMR
ncbi:GGDEF domain-containing protein [Desulfovibrio sp. OttesenSCG-928-A18]|nr:GGDEF domain-containing protein [Desulfovibrio sp. OttesenSCG-928-A18]